MIQTETMACELCARDASTTVAVEAGHSIVKCRNCGLVQVRPLPQEQETGNTAYWQTDLDSPGTQRSRKGNAAVYEYGLKRVEAVSGRSLKDKKVLDVGCGMGVFLDVVKEAGGFRSGWISHRRRWTIHGGIRELSR